MPDASPAADAAEGQEPAADDQGQEPAGDAAATDPPPAPEGQQQPRAYTESYVRQLRRESSGYRTRLAEVEARLQEHEESGKTEAEKLSERLAKAEKTATEASARLIRYEVAAEHGLDMKAAQFLTGTTREEIELRAEELAKLLAEKGKPPTTSFGGGARQPVPDTRPPEEAHNDFLLDALRGNRTP